MDVSTNPQRAEVFDHSHALLGREGIPRLSRLQNEFGIDGDANGSGNRHCLLDHIQEGDDFEQWHERITETPEFLIENACSDMRELNLLTSNEAASVIEFLKFRQRNIRRLVQLNHNQFKSMPEPSLWMGVPGEMAWDGPHI